MQKVLVTWGDMNLPAQDEPLADQRTYWTSRTHPSLEQPTHFAVTSLNWRVKYRYLGGAVCESWSSGAVDQTDPSLELIHLVPISQHMEHSYLSPTQTRTLKEVFRSKSFFRLYLPRKCRCNFARINHLSLHQWNFPILLRVRSHAFTFCKVMPHARLSSARGRFRHSPWLLGPPSPSSQSVMLFSILSPPRAVHTEHGSFWEKKKRRKAPVGLEPATRWTLLLLPDSSFLFCSQSKKKAVSSFLFACCLIPSVSLREEDGETESGCRGELMMVLAVTHMHGLSPCAPLTPLSV